MYVTGVNYRRAEVGIRGRYALDAEQRARFYDLARKRGLGPLILLSTCNRTEIYGLGDVRSAGHLLCELTGQPQEEWLQHSFVLREREAVNHAFEVAAGLDSQILGDVEILGQFREAFKEAKHYGALDGWMERLGNACIQAARELRSQTSLSGGTVSASYAAVQLLKERRLREGTRVLLLGLGSFGTSVARNLRTHLPGLQLRLVNRTAQRAEQLAAELAAEWMSMEELDRALADSDILVATVGATGGYLLPYARWGSTPLSLVLDLSVPQAVEAPHFHEEKRERYLNIDAVSSLIDRSLAFRASSLPAARKMLAEKLGEFYRWSALYERRGEIRGLKATLLEESRRCPFWAGLAEGQHERLIQEAVAEYARFLKGRTALAGDRGAWLAEYADRWHETVAGEVAGKCPVSSQTAEL